MPRRVLLVMLLVCNCALFALTLAGNATPATGQSPKLTPTPEPLPLLVLRVMTKTRAEAQRLVNGGWDVLEMRQRDALLGDALFVMGDAEVQRRLAAQGFEVSVAQSLGLQAPDTYFNGYRTVVEHDAHLDSVAAAHPDLATVIDYGDSWKKLQGQGGFDLRAICITKIQMGDCALNPNSTKPRFLLMAAIHARELSTSEMAWRWIDFLVSGYNADPEITALLDHNELWVVPVVNPDGRAIVEQGGNSPYLQRKNANNTQGNCSVPPSTSSQHGIDLNRNASTDNWGGLGTSTFPCDLTYRGTSGASEPEQSFLQQFLANLFPDTKGPARNDPADSATRGLFITLHSYSDLVLFPYGDATSSGYAPNDAQLRALAFRLSYFNNYVTGTGDEVLYATTGTTDDWVYGTLGAPSFTFEIGPANGGCSGFTPAYGCQDSTFWPLNKDAFVYAAKSARQPYATAAGPSALLPSLSQSSTAAGNSVVVNAVIDDGRLGNALASIGRPAAQAISAAEIYVDTPPWAGGAPITMTAQDGTFNASSEIATALLNTSGWSVGRHTLFVRGRDSANNWGPTTAQWLTVTVSEPTTTPTPFTSPTPTPPNATATPPKPTPRPRPGTVQINFQPVNAPYFPGFLMDVGDAFANRGNGYGYGWSSNNAVNTRDRNASDAPDQRYDTLAFMQRGTARSWEIALPNGHYEVTLVAGDAIMTNSIYKIAAEGVLVVDGVPSDNMRWLSGKAVVRITDGRLTIDNAPGSSNNKISFIEIVPSAALAESPNVITNTLAMQASLNVTMNANGARLDWVLPSGVSQANNIIGFHVFRGASARRDHAQLLTSELIRVSQKDAVHAHAENYSFVDTTIQTNVEYNYWLTAVDAMSATTDIGPVMESLQDRVRLTYFPRVFRE